MWKRWETVTETERCKIVEIANKYEVPMRDVASMFQSGLDFDKISKKIEGDSWVVGIFDVADNTEVCMPNIEPNNKLN